MNRTAPFPVDITQRLQRCDELVQAFLRHWTPSTASHATVFRLAQLRAATSALQCMFEDDPIVDDYGAFMKFARIFTGVTTAHIKRCCRTRPRAPDAAYLAVARAELIETWVGIEREMYPRLANMMKEFHNNDPAL